MFIILGSDCTGWIIFSIHEVFIYLIANQKQHSWHLNTHDILSTSLHGRDTTILWKGWLIRNSTRDIWASPKSWARVLLCAHCVCRVIYLLVQSLVSSDLIKKASLVCRWESFSIYIHESKRRNSGTFEKKLRLGLD